MKKTCALLALAGLFLAGCGGDSASLQGFSANSPLPADNQLIPMVVGKVALGAPGVGARVQFLSLDGRALGPQLVCDASGNFSAPARLLPEDFRVSVQLPGSSLAIFHEVRGNRGESRVIWVHLVNHVISLAVQQNPALSLEQARQLARRRWKLASGFSFDEPLLEAGAFSQAVFMTRAGQAGGLQRFAASAAADLLTAGATGSAPPEFSFQGVASVQPLPEAGGLEAELVPFAQAARRNVLLTAEPSGNLFTAAFSTLAQNELKEGIAQGLGWIASSIGWNFFPGTTTFSIEKELEQISLELDRLAQVVASGFIEETYRQLQRNLELAATAPTLSKAQQLAQIQKTSTITNQPFLPSSSQTGLLAGLTTVNVGNYLTALQKALTGPTSSNLVALYLQLQMTNLGVDQNTRYLNFPLRKLSIQQQIPLSYYQQWQTLAAYLLAEAAHVNLTAEPPLSGQINDAVNNYNAAALQIKLQNQQVFSNLPDGVLIDQEFGLMYYLEIQSPMNFSAASSWVDGLKVGAYDDWVLPSSEDCSKLLQQRFRYISGSDGDFGKTVLGMAKLDFTTQNLDSDQNIWISDPASKNEAYYFRLTHEHSLDNKYADAVNGLHAVLAVRHYPNLAAGSPDLTQEGLRAGATVSSSAATPLTLTVGSTGSLTLGNNTMTATQLRAEGAYLLSSGGKFTAGTTTKQNDYNLALVSSPVTTANVTDLVAWNVTGNSSQGQVLNLPGYEGQLIWQPDISGGLQPVTVQASIAGTDASGAPTVHTQTLTVQPPTPTPIKKLKSLLVSPRNLLYTVYPIQGNNQFRAYAFFEDNSVVDVTGSSDWTAVSNTTGLPLNNVVMSSNSKGVLLVNALPGESNIRIQATYQTTADNTTVQVALP